MTDSNSSSTPKKWIVGIQQHRPSPGRTVGTIVKLPDPGNGDMRDYATMTSMNGNCNGNDNGNDSYIAEFQSMSENFSSFIVGRHIVRDGDLYVINRIDPLFFYLATQPVDGQQQQQQQGGTINDENNNDQQPKKQSWQPYDLILEQSKLPREITNCISIDQIQHVCLTFENDELYFKFNTDRALKWLQKKQERLFQALVRQDQRKQKAKEQQRRSNGVESNNGPMGGSVSANFNFGGKPSTATPATTASPVQQETSKPTTTTIPKSNSDSDTHSLKIESFQIICNYLNETWSKKFIEHLGHSIEEVKSDTPKSSIVSPNSNNGGNGSSYSTKQEEIATTMTKTTAAQKAVVAASSRTMGNKRLAKVSTKGMKSIGSFFGAGKAKKPKR